VDFFTGIWSIYKTIHHIDIAKAGLIAGVAGCAGEILQPFFGHLCDCGYRKKIILIGLGFSSFILFIPLSANLFFSFVILLFLNLGSSAFHPAASGMVPTLVSANKARTLLFFNSGGAAGFGFSQIIFCSLFYAFKEFFSLFIIIPLACILFLIFHRFPDQNLNLSPFNFKHQLKLSLQHRKALIFLYFSQVSYQGMRSTFLFFFPEILRARCSSLWLWQGGGFLFFVLGSLFSMIPAGHLCDKYGPKKTLLIAAGGAILLFYSLIFAKDLSIVSCLILLTCLGALFGIINPLTVAWGHILIPESPSTVSGFLMGMAWCIGNLGPVLAGSLHNHFEQNSDRLLLIILGALLVFVFFLLLAAPAPKKALENRTAHD
jgi:MFS transporter, FSR family, fosmidomycin resistance protein